MVPLSKFRFFSGRSENSRAEPKVIPACQFVLDGGGARVVLDPLDHRTHAIGALRRQMRRKAETLEQAFGINGKYARCRLAGIESQQKSQEAAHNMSVAVSL